MVVNLDEFELEGKILLVNLMSFCLISEGNYILDIDQRRIQIKNTVKIFCLKFLTTYSLLSPLKGYKNCL